MLLKIENHRWLYLEEIAISCWISIRSIVLSLKADFFPKIGGFTTLQIPVDQDTYIITFWKHFHFYEWLAILQKNKAHTALDLEE